MQTKKLRFLRCGIRVICYLVFLSSLMPSRHASAQRMSESQYYSRVNSFGVLAAYSADSSHIILGLAEKRKLWNIGGSYSRRLFVAHGTTWQYDAELLPMALEGDPLSREVIHQTSPTNGTAIFDGGPTASCAPSAWTYTYTDPKGVIYSGDATLFCHGRQWTMGEAMSPLGLQWNFRTRHRIQPLFTAHIGYMYSTKPIPVGFAGAFNFTFDAGPGFELYRTRTQSVRVEYRYHHISNHNSASENPGIDNSLFQLSYVFGR